MVTQSRVLPFLKLRISFFIFDVLFISLTPLSRPIAPCLAPLSTLFFRSCLCILCSMIFYAPSVSNVLLLPLIFLPGIFSRSSLFFRVLPLSLSLLVLCETLLARCSFFCLWLRLDESANFRLFLLQSPLRVMIFIFPIFLSFGPSPSLLLILTSLFPRPLP